MKNVWNNKKTASTLLALVIVFWVASCLFILSAVGYIVGYKMAQANENIVVTRCISPSMAPTIETNAWVYTDTSFPFEDIEKGDIILFKTDRYGKAVNHRVKQVNIIEAEDGLTYKQCLTAGDNTTVQITDLGWEVTENGLEGPSKADYLGKVVKVNNGVKPLVDFLFGVTKVDDDINSHFLVLALLSMATLMLTSCYIVCYRKKYKK